MKNKKITGLLLAAVLSGNVFYTSASSLSSQESAEQFLVDNPVLQDTEEEPELTDDFIDQAEDAKIPSASDTVEAFSYPVQTDSSIDISVDEEPDISDGEISEVDTTALGEYIFYGYLSDGTPNYVWHGEGKPAVLDNVYDVMLTADLSDDISAQAYQEFNYLKDAVKILDRTAEMSDSTSSLSDGLHTAPDGKVRAYKGGKYFKKGRFALDGQVYYADVNGCLYSGWIAVSKTGNLSSKKKSDYVWKYCDPNTYVRFENGKKVIDGICHYFIPESSGNLAFNKGISFSDGYYFCDNYGVCGKVKRKYSSGYIDTSSGDDSYLAVNQLPSSNVVNLYNKVMDGSYSFYPKWYSGVSAIETFGFTPITTTSGTAVYCALSDESQKGKIGCWYRKIGKFHGRQVDIKCTITDYTFYDFVGDTEVGYFQVSLNKIGLNATNLRDITANMEFYDHETGQPVKVKGFATFADIDICQGLEILSGTDQVYVDENCKLYKDPTRNLFTAPWEEGLNGSVVEDADREYWVEADYNSYNLSYKFYSARENYDMISNYFSGPVNGESKCVWAQDYNDNVNDYDIVNTAQGILWQGWQGLYYGRLGRISISPLTKTVSDSDEKDTVNNTLSAKDESFVYRLYQYVPSETKDFRYESYQVYDDLPGDLLADAASLKVRLDDGTDVTDRFSIAISGSRVTFSAKNTALSSDNFYNNNYCFCIGVSIKETEHVNDGRNNGSYTVRNTGHAVFSRTLGQGTEDRETADSNEVETTVSFPWISIKKTDVNTQEILKDAEFMIYEYSTLAGGYKASGKSVSYTDTCQAYISPRLDITRDNLGKFKLKEIRPPKGYTGNWEQEITLKAENLQKPNLELTVTNEPDLLPRGEITVVKKIKEADIIWAHGNPSFPFQIKGTDTRGNTHIYEDIITFEKNNYTKDSQGYALCEITFSNIPIGTYDITEKKVLRYYLAEAASGSSNVTIHNKDTGAYGKNPEDTAYACAVLSVETPHAIVSFRNEKARFDGYSHTDSVKNTVTFA